MALRLGCRMGLHAWGEYKYVGIVNIKDMGLLVGQKARYVTKCETCGVPKHIRKDF